LLSHFSRDEVLVGVASFVAGVLLPLLLLELVRRQRFMAGLLLPLRGGPHSSQNAPGKLV
jgi:hypothetical protein